MEKNKGIIIIASYLVIIVLAIFIVVFIARTINERNIASKEKELKQALHLAEAGINRAIYELRTDYNWTGISSVNLGGGQYSVSITSEGDRRKIISWGFIPQVSGYRTKKTVEVVIKKYISPNFYDNAIYTADELDLNGNAYVVNGNVIYGDPEPAGNTGNINGTITQDTSIYPLVCFNFQQLHDISEAQGNVYNDQRLRNVQKNLDSFPSSFWYSPPTNPEDPTTGIPNIVYIETDLQLNGNIGTIGGFFVVVGDVITNPLGTYDATINGNGQIDGCIYTLGTFEVNGGGGGLNVFGGVWAGVEAELNGNTNVTYNRDYMEAIKGLNINPDIQIISWREISL